MAGTSSEHRFAGGDEPARPGTELARIQRGSHPVDGGIAPADSHGAIAPADSHGAIAPVSYNPDAPSEEWGWHGSWREFAPRGSTILLGVGVLGLLLLIFGNHESMVEDYWLGVIAILTAVWLFARRASLKKEQARRP